MDTKLTFVISIFFLFFLMSAVSASENATDIEMAEDSVLNQDLSVDDVLQEDSSNDNGSRLDTYIIAEDSIQGEAGSAVYFSVDILDENDNPVMNGTATLSIAGKNYTSEVLNGTAIFQGVLIEDGMKTATVYYHGNEWYNSSQMEIEVYLIEEFYFDMPVLDETTDIAGPLFEEPQKTRNHAVVKAASESNQTGNPIFFILLSLMVISSSAVINRKR